jgi:hypothetical protein
MTRTSSSAPDASFRTALLVTVVALALLCGAFAALTLLQGPKLASAQVDSRAAITAPGQALRLFANSPVAEVAPSAVSVTPAVPFTVTTDGKIISITFGLALRFGTDYHVVVDGVTAVNSDRPSTFSHAFSTPSPPVYYLDCGEATDEIVRTGLSGAARDVVYAAPGIQAFAVVTPTVTAVVTTTSAGGSALSIVDGESGLAEDVALPGEGTITGFALSDVGHVLGFVFTDARADDPLSGEDPGILDRVLFRLDLDAGRELVPATGYDGAPLGIYDWRFVPGGSSVVALTGDRSAFYITPDGDPEPLGQLTELGHVSRTGATMAVRTALGSAVLDLETTELSFFDVSPLGGEEASPGEAEVLANGDRVQRIAVFDKDSGRYASFVVLDDGDSSRVLYETPDSLGSITSFSVSPNEQYVAIEAVEDYANAVSDGYPGAPKASSAQTVVVDIESGAVVRIVEGVNWLWK